MNARICVLTATRAEYGLLRPLILKLKQVAAFDVHVVVTGAHLAPEFGLTYKDIEHDGIEIDEKIEILLCSDTPSSISKSMGLAMIGFAEYFRKLKPDMLIVLGDRYETFAVAATAANQRIPIAHLYGGETTEGAVDEAYRHSITKMSYLHFTSTEVYRRRVIQLGEDPARVFCVGAIGIENILNEKLMDKLDLENSLQFILDRPYAVVTYHPVTLDDSDSQKQIEALLDICSSNKGLKYIITKANADVNGRIINKVIDDYVTKYDHMIVFASLGTTRYLSALKYATLVIGNSSSGIIEAPSFGISTINIGNRQKGRIQASSVINCDPTHESIQNALNAATSSGFLKKAKATKNPYGSGNTTELIVSTIYKIMSGQKIDLTKQFFDIEV